MRVKHDADGKEMIYPWKASSGGTSGGISNGVIVYLELDNRGCENNPGAECFLSASEAAEYLAATAVSHTLPKTFPIYQVRGISSPDTPANNTPANGTYIAVGVIMTLLIGLLLGVMVTAQRKRAHGITWFPEGFLTNNNEHRRSRRKGPDGQEMRNMKQQAISCLEGNSNHWSDDESELPPAKRARGGDSEYEHMWPPHSGDNQNSLILTPPSLDNNTGQYGMNCLMPASARSTNLETGDEEEDENTAAHIADLVAQGVDINAAMDKTGETALHRAARYARSDKSKRLLDAGADANSQDNTGRTPLHAAVAADAMGVFQILLRNRATDLNAKMHDGTTPLILAARLAIEGMVEDLINADADINLADNSGKTALHWASAVNNTDAVNILLAHGANRDAQDDKDETPLFLAAREGSFEACKALLDNFANREITDHMDRLPRDVASERLHHDIVRLLNEHVPHSPQMVSVNLNGSTLLSSPNHHHHLISQPTVIGSGKGGSAKAKKRLNKNNGSLNSPDSDNTQSVRRKNSIKNKSNKKPSSLEGTVLPGLEASLYDNSVIHQLPSYEDCNKAMPMQSLGIEYPYSGLHGFQEPSPPHSVTLSPSPAKTRGPNLPTSPTHMAAMRVATHQKQLAMQFDFSDTLCNNMGPPYQQPLMNSGLPTQPYHNFTSHYLTPPSEAPPSESFPTDSPESPLYWSSSSPHSNSDWSEGISSPNAQQTGSKQADGLYV